MNNVLYSPWRLQYILSEKENKCVFCIEDEDEKHYIVYRSEKCFVILNLYPYNNGHIMVIPNRHISELGQLTTEELHNLFETVQKSEKVLKEVYHCEGINVGINLGKAAGAGVDAHLHVHLVPRWSGDCNFMTTVGGTRVIPESMQRTYQRIKEQFDNLYG